MGPTKYLQNKTLKLQVAGMACSETNRHKGMQTGRQIDRRTERERQKDGQTDRQRDRDRWI